MTPTSACNPSSAPLNARSEFAPVALFVYNRIEHTQKTVNSLQKNKLAAQSDLFVFSDGPKYEAGAVEVQQLRRYIPTIRGFKSLTIIEREKNLGLAISVISGVTELCNEFGRVIVVEDDLLTTVDFLAFMNQSLDRYENEPRIFSISGFNFGLNTPKHYPYDAFCFYRSSSWGWGTWKNRWDQADWEVTDYDSFCCDKEQQRQFSRGGDDLSSMLALQMHGKIDSWAIRWAYTHFKQDALALLSLRSLVYHFGSDGAATHSRRESLRQSPLTGEHKSEFHFPEKTGLEEDFVLALQKSLRPSLARKLVRYFLHGRISLATKRVNSGDFLRGNAQHSAPPVTNRRSLVD
jgi:hypothetical protein